MEAVSPAGVIGALAGLIFGWVDYKMVGSWIERKLRETDRSQAAADKADYERRIGLFRGWFLLSTVGVFPVVGYFVGRSIGSM